MHRPRYANVTATLALVVALGGTSYAVTQVTGKDVKNGSLSGKDIKKKSVPLDRLKGSLPTTSAPVDPGQFVPSTGLYTVTAGPGGWQSTNAGLRRNSSFGGWISSTSNDGAGMLLDPAVTTTVAGRAMRLQAATICWDATATVTISGVVVSTFREDAAGNVSDVVEVEDAADHTDKTCKRYAFAQPVTLTPTSRVSLRLQLGWSAIGATIQIGGVTLELVRA
jgi:hypothetical protein